MHKDKFFSSFTDIKKEDWDKIFGSPEPYKAGHFARKVAKDELAMLHRVAEARCLTQESS